ncbi:MAG: FecR domain-containing protein [Corticimicrobacter sp.]|uniref:FecR domain-containing protein n=1 Tax=Corticimicrobacter sp. TaxID=2678536 RepID=UPI0032DBAC20
MSPDLRRGRPVPIPEAVIEAAISWSIRLHHGEPSEQTHVSFERWLLTDRLHALAWERITSLSQPFAGMPAPLLNHALDRVQIQRTRRQAQRRTALQALSMGGLLAGLGWMAQRHTPWQRLVADASTVMGERHQWQLDDGTTLHLNTDSAVRTDFGPLRRIVLTRGEVAIRTGADIGQPVRRPFWVQTPFGRLQALGTRFTVRLMEHGVRIGVQEGAVALYPADAAEAVHIVKPGETYLLGTDVVATENMQGMRVDGWTQGVIAGEDMPLSLVLGELARYRAGLLRWDEAVAGLRVSGLFHLQDTDRALQFLAQTQPVRIRYLTRYWVSVGALHEN